MVSIGSFSGGAALELAVVHVVIQDNTMAEQTVADAILHQVAVGVAGERENIGEEVLGAHNPHSAVVVGSLQAAHESGQLGEGRAGDGGGGDDPALTNALGHGGAACAIDDGSADSGFHLRGELVDEPALEGRDAHRLDVGGDLDGLDQLLGGQGHSAHRVSGVGAGRGHRDPARGVDRAGGRDGHVAGDVQGIDLTDQLVLFQLAVDLVQGLGGDDIGRAGESGALFDGHRLAHQVLHVSVTVFSRVRSKGADLFHFFYLFEFFDFFDRLLAAGNSLADLCLLCLVVFPSFEFLVDRTDFCFKSVQVGFGSIQLRGDGCTPLDQFVSAHGLNFHWLPP